MKAKDLALNSTTYAYQSYKSNTSAIEVRVLEAPVHPEMWTRSGNLVAQRHRPKNYARVQSITTGNVRLIPLAHITSTWEDFQQRKQAALADRERRNAQLEDLNRRASALSERLEALGTNLSVSYREGAVRFSGGGVQATMDKLERLVAMAEQSQN